MYIQPNKFLSPTSRVIKPYQCSMIATEGPNIIGKLNLSGVELEYESQFTSKMTLNPGAKDQPVLFGFLGSNVTFLLIKFTFDETDPRCAIEEEQYIEYWFENEPSVMHYSGKLLLLTGNSAKRIPQVYLTNNSSIGAYADVMVANMEQSDIDLNDVTNNIELIQNLYHNSILSDTFWNVTENTSGSTQLQVNDLDDRIILYLDYDEIDTIEIDEIKFKLNIKTKSDAVIHLMFLSLFEVRQAYSRISWVMSDSLTRTLSKELPMIDLESPVVTLVDTIIPISSNTYIMPFERDVTTNEFVITSDEILEHFIDSIIDSTDGIISIYDSVVQIRKVGFVENLLSITELGTYDILITINDIAQNTAILNLTLVIDDEAPSIQFKTDIEDVFSMNIPDDIQLPNGGILKDDIIRKSVDYAFDSVQGTIPNSNIEVFLDDNVTVLPFTEILNPGEYKIIYSITDDYGNNETYNKTLTVVGDIILIDGSEYSIISSDNILSFKYDDDIDTSATIIIGGENIIVSNIFGGVNNSQLVWDQGGVNEHIFTTPDEYITLSYDNILYEITFITWGSLYFNITSLGEAPLLNDLTFLQSYVIGGGTGFTDTVLEYTDNEFIINIDNNEDSIYNIGVFNNVTYNRDTLLNTNVYLESHDVSDSILQDYYVNKYPTENITILENILNGTIEFANMFELNNNIVINGSISSDNINSIVLYGNYPIGLYTFRIELIDENGFENTMRFKFNII